MQQTPNRVIGRERLWTATPSRATEAARSFRTSSFYSFSYPHLFTNPTVQQPVSTQASYRLWQTRCAPQCNRACEHVARCWADASLQDIATNGTPSMTATTAPKTKDALISFSLRLLMWPNVPDERAPPKRARFVPFRRIRTTLGSRAAPHPFALDDFTSVAVRM
jgi:hypothetical protein